jgi:hypothetical protein
VIKILIIGQKVTFNSVSTIKDIFYPVQFVVGTYIYSLVQACTAGYEIDTFSAGYQHVKLGTNM